MNDRFETDIDRIHAHLVELTRVPRPCESAELQAARVYVTQSLEASGWSVYAHDFDVYNDAGELQLGETLHGVNLLASRNGGGGKTRPRLVVGAHLDSRPDTPGADDNASAVATLLEIARLITQQELDDAELALELVAFDLEENGMLGGAEHARLVKQSGVDLRGMISLEMLGYCDHTPGSQSLPRSLAGMYPDTGDFIAVVGNQDSTELIERFSVGIRQTPDLPVETLQVPSNGDFLQATRLSDHSPFWDAGFPALMITDTSFMRNPHYHQETDTLETLDMDFLQKVSEGCLRAVRHLLRTGLAPAND